MLVRVSIKDAGDLKPFLSDTSVFIIDVPIEEQLFCILLMSWILKLVVKDKPAAAAAQPQAAPAPVEASIPNRPELVAAVSAAIAEDLGTDISKIEIKSIKKL